MLQGTPADVWAYYRAVTGKVKNSFWIYFWYFATALHEDDSEVTAVYKHTQKRYHLPSNLVSQNSKMNLKRIWLVQNVQKMIKTNYMLANASARCTDKLECSCFKNYWHLRCGINSYVVEVLPFADSRVVLLAYLLALPLSKHPFSFFPLHCP